MKTWKIDEGEIDWEEFWGRHIAIENDHGNGETVGGQLQVIVMDEFNHNELAPYTEEERDDLMRRIAARIEQVLNEEFA